jgi:hypothetical protein
MPGPAISGPTTDDAMTRSEEQLRVGTDKQATGSPDRTRTHHRRQHRAAMDGPAISEDEHEVVLHEERPVVEKETIPVERIRLDKDTVTENVTEEVRKENIETDGMDDSRR